jgi:exodeoxyribonuclease VII small subunit
MVAKAQIRANPPLPSLRRSASARFQNSDTMSHLPKKKICIRHVGEIGGNLALNFAARALYIGPMPKAKGAESAVDEIQKLSFEEALKRLEGIVESMEAQELPLETLLTQYQEGTTLAQLCQAKLNAAELKVQQLEKNSKGELTLKPVQTAEEE